VRSLTLAFSSHRPETLPYAEAAMRGHDAIVLEEPGHPQFSAMLSGEVSIEDYLLDSEYEYPEFARGLCRVLRRFAAAGAPVLQIDPFMDELAAIHWRFADGQSPSDIEPGTAAHTVYSSERTWTAALIAFYRASVTSDFDSVVRAVKRFARADAARGRLRDRMRALALAELSKNYRRIYVETGYIHQYLPYVLKRLVPPEVNIERLWLTAPVVRPETGKSRVMGPGDTLTVASTFKPGFDGPAADLMAAQSLIHVKALYKEEIVPSQDNPAPHTMDEIEVNRMVSALTYDDCRHLYELVRGLPTDRARKIISGFRAQ
jgi:hypothetical protein